MLDPANDMGGANDPKRYAKITQQLSPLDVRRIARILYEGRRAVRVAFDRDTPRWPDWQHAPQSVQDESERVVRLIGMGKVQTPEALHEDWLFRMQQAGYRHGMLHDPERRTHPAMLDFGALSIHQQLAYYDTFTRAQTLLTGVAMLRFGGK